MNDEFNFKGDNPGAVRFGNFINYYNFNPVENRIDSLPKHIWKTQNNVLLCLDIGCNSGDLTSSLYQFICEHIENKLTNCKFLGIDVDPTLILRATEHFSSDNLRFDCLDIMNVEHSVKINEYLHKFKVNKFSFIFCMSITMWIHLNHGDEGLKRFFKHICSLCDIIVVEPQPWKCYKTAVKRLKQVNCSFPQFGQLKIRQNIEGFIENFLEEECDMVKIYEAPQTKWGRKILFYCKTEIFRKY